MSHFWAVLKGIWSCAKSMAASEIFALACGYFSIATHCGSMSEGGGGECGKLDGRLLLSFWWCWLCWAHDLDAALPSMPSVLNNNVTILGYLPCGLYPRKPSSFHVPHPSMYPPPKVPPSPALQLKCRRTWKLEKGEIARNEFIPWLRTVAKHIYMSSGVCTLAPSVCVCVCVLERVCARILYMRNDRNGAGG